MGWRRKNLVIILGAGPAGMFAAHAAFISGYNVHILSNRLQPSRMNGAQYLHRRIPELPASKFSVLYRLKGTAEEYRRKVYGDLQKIPVSPESLDGEQTAYDIRLAYSVAYQKYVAGIHRVDSLDYDSLRAAIDWKKVRHVFSTIPARSICGNQAHVFRQQTAYAIGDAPEIGVFAPPVTGENEVLCNGESEPAWYRASCIQGYRSMEWPSRRKPPIRNVAEIVKPIDSTCDCFVAEGLPFTSVGRYGKWNKGALSHDAYYQTMEELRK